MTSAVRGVTQSVTHTFFLFETLFFEAFSQGKIRLQKILYL
jgi:hypothetical protein